MGMPIAPMLALFVLGAAALFWSLRLDRLKWLRGLSDAAEDDEVRRYEEATGRRRRAWVAPSQRSLLVGAAAVGALGASIVAEAFYAGGPVTPDRISYVTVDATPTPTPDPAATPAPTPSPVATAAVPDPHETVAPQPPPPLPTPAVAPTATPVPAYVPSQIALRLTPMPGTSPPGFYLAVWDVTRDQPVTGACGTVTATTVNAEPPTTESYSGCTGPPPAWISGIVAYPVFAGGLQAHGFVGGFKIQATFAYLGLSASAAAG